jgi:SAM-dependent methyltransferase
METWASAGPYERYMGRWSRRVAAEFLGWISIPSGASWADVGCGTGGLARSILASCHPRAVAGVDSSEAYLAEARGTVTDKRASFSLADATTLPWDSSSFDATVSGLVLNFVPDHRRTLGEMRRVTKPGGRVAAYVWDYAHGMQMTRHFWDAAVSVNPLDSALDQAERFPICQPGPLGSLFRSAGLTSVSVEAIDIEMLFRDFDDYWNPFLGKQGAAPSYLASLDAGTRERIRNLLQSRLVPAPDGSIAMTARAWAVQGTV